jgi:hypothetical protein
VCMNVQKLQGDHPCAAASQLGQVLRLSKPRAKPRPPHAVALEETLWAEHADIIDQGTVDLQRSEGALGPVVVCNKQSSREPCTVYADPMRRACAFIDQVAGPLLGEVYVAQQVRALCY